MRSARRAAATAAVATLLLLTPGCTRSAPPREEPPPVSTTSSPRAPGQAPELPLDRLFWSDQDYTTVHRALDTLTRRCMEGAGLAMPAGAFTPLTRQPRNVHRYGTIRRDEAESHGYHPAPQAPAAPAASATPPTPEQITALAGTGNGRPGPHGTPSEGCNGWSARQLTGSADYPSDPELLRRLDSESFGLAVKDPRTVEVITAWAHCMRAAGVTPAATPAEKPPALGTGPSPGPEEIHAATRDVSCKERTRLVEVWSAVESGHQRTLLGRHAAEIREIETRRRSTLARATEVLGPAGP